MPEVLSLMDYCFYLQAASRCMGFLELQDATFDALAGLCLLALHFLFRLELFPLGIS